VNYILKKHKEKDGFFQTRILEKHEELYSKLCTAMPEEDE
jgi:hypothetical protein